MEDDPEDWRTFHNLTREYVVFLLLFINLYFASYCLISIFKKRLDYCTGTYEDAVVYRISLWMSAFSLGVSIGAALLLPISIIANEVLLYYPNSYYVQWLNTSLIQGLWSHVFLFSNISLFILLPFAHLFIESEGFPGSQKGIMARVYEALLVLVLLGMLIMGITCIISAILDYGHYNFHSFFNVSNYFLPFLYSCVSFLGVLMLLLCTPVGFARLFSVMGELLLKPKINLHPTEQYADLMESQQLASQHSANVPHYSSVYFCPEKILDVLNPKKMAHHLEDSNCVYRGPINARVGLTGKVNKAHEESSVIENENGNLVHSAVRRNLGYPFVMLLLLILTTVSVLMVIQNTLMLCFGIKNLPVYSQNLSLGNSSLSALGPVGSGLEIILILYLWCASIVGLYSLPVFCRLRPRFHCTSMTQVIGNCAVLLVLSSALPVLARSLGITNFDLLGDFGRINWLGSIYIVLFQNVVFVVASAICLGTKITAAVRRELYDRLCAFTWTSLFRANRQHSA